MFKWVLEIVLRIAALSTALVPFVYGPTEPYPVYAVSGPFPFSHLWTPYPVYWPDGYRLKGLGFAYSSTMFPPLWNILHFVVNENTTHKFETECAMRKVQDANSTLTLDVFVDARGRERNGTYTMFFLEEGPT